MRGVMLMKRLLSIFLALCMVLYLLPIGAAAAAPENRDLTFELAMSADLKALGLFQGVGTNDDGSTDFDLDRAPTRLEALVMLIRLLGKDAEAKACPADCPFTDVPGWGKPYVAYAYVNGLTKGSSATQFGMGNATASMYRTFVLRALGYDDTAGDFSWDDNLALSNEVGILPEGVDLENFWRADAVAISYAALYAKVKDGSQTLYEKLISQSVFTEATFTDVADDRLLLAHTIPDLRLEGNWPVTDEYLQEKWELLYPYFCRYLGLPTKILTEGITWGWDNNITPDTVGYYSETNSFVIGPLPQHNNLSPENDFEYEPAILQGMHETAHLYWQIGTDYLKFDFGQWAWEAAALVAQSMYYYDVRGEHDPNHYRCFDMINLCGWDAINGVMNDGNKYDRSTENGSATDAFVYLCSVLSDDGTLNFFQKVNDLRLQLYKKTGSLAATYTDYLSMLDEVAGGCKIDGIKPSEWLKALPVSNTDGATGDYLMTYPNRLIDDRASVSLACWNRYTDEHGDKREKAYAQQSVKLDVYDPSGKLVGSRTVQTRNQGTETADIQLSPGIPNNTALRVVATSTVNGKPLSAENYLVYCNEGIPGRTADELMYAILLDSNGNIVTDLKAADMKVSGAKSIDTSALSHGLLILSAGVGDSVEITAGGQTFIRSQPIGVRVLPLKVK